MWGGAWRVGGAGIPFGVFWRFGGFVALVALGCSASGGEGQGVEALGGSGGAPVIGQGGSDAAPPVPGVESMNPSGFNVDDPGVPDNRCNELDVEFEKIVPTVAVLVDRSKSMFEANTGSTRAQLWDPLFDALTNPADGVIPALQADVRFGFTAYNRDDAVAAACPNLQTVPIALENAAAITQAYAAAGVLPANYYKWDTPTAESVRAVTQQLADFAEVGPKYILLVTDGNPDRCAEADPQCGQDDAIAAVQAAFAAGITTYVVGIGDVATVAANPDAAGCWGRCGPLHLQDLANAGTGAPVLRNADQNFLNNCFDGRRDLNGIQQYVATYTDDPTLAGSAPFFAPNGRAALREALSSILAGVRSCTFVLTEVVRAGRESTGTVLLDGEPLTYGEADGWSLTDGTNVQITGAACERVQNEARSVDISFPCEAYIQ